MESPIAFLLTHDIWTNLFVLLLLPAIALILVAAQSVRTAIRKRWPSEPRS